MGEKEQFELALQKPCIIIAKSDNDILAIDDIAYNKGIDHRMVIKPRAFGASCGAALKLFSFHDALTVMKIAKAQGIECFTAWRENNSWIRYRAAMVQW